MLRLVSKIISWDKRSSLFPVEEEKQFFKTSTTGVVKRLTEAGFSHSAYMDNVS
jgi:hypothetical protein